MNKIDFYEYGQSFYNGEMINKIIRKHVKNKVLEYVDGYFDKLYTIGVSIEKTTNNKKHIYEYAKYR